MEGVQVFTVNVFQVCCIKHCGKNKDKNKRSNTEDHDKVP